MKALGSLLIAGLIITYWWAALTLLLIYLIAKAAPIAYRELQTERTTERQQLQALIARADTQHHQTLNGDPKGMYGIYPVMSY